MSPSYFAVLTEVGAAKLAAASGLGKALTLSHMAVGDGNGVTPLPDATQQALVRENYRAPLNRLFIDPAHPNQIIVEQVISEDIGGWWIRELGLYDSAGDLCAIANCPPSYKPQLAEGSGRTQVIRMVLIVSSTAAVELTIDPSAVLATCSYVKAYAAQKTHQHDAQDVISGQFTIARLPEALLQRIDALEAQIKQGVPVGSIGEFPAHSAPIGWQECNGTLLSRADYSALYAFAVASGNMTTTDTQWQAGMFSPGDGATTFRIPDARGHFRRAWDHGKGIDPERVLGSVQTSQNLEHCHDGVTEADGGHAHNGATTVDGWHAHSGATAEAGWHGHSGSTTTNGWHGHTTHTNCYGISGGASAVGSGVCSPNYGQAGGVSVRGEGNHYHTFNTDGAGMHAHSFGTAGEGNHAHTFETNAVNHHSHSITTASSGGVEARPCNIAWLVCIKT